GNLARSGGGGLRKRAAVGRGAEGARRRDTAHRGGRRRDGGARRHAAATGVARGGRRGRDGGRGATAVVAAATARRKQGQAERQPREEIAEMHGEGLLKRGARQPCRLLAPPDRRITTPATRRGGRAGASLDLLAGGWDAGASVPVWVPLRGGPGTPPSPCGPTRGESFGERGRGLFTR